MKNLNWMGFGAGVLIAAQFLVAWAFIEESNTLERELEAVRDSAAALIVPSCKVTSHHITPGGDLMIVWLCPGEYLE